MKKSILIISIIFSFVSSFSQYDYYDPSEDIPIYENDTLEIEKVVFYRSPLVIYNYELLDEKLNIDWIDDMVFIINPGLYKDNSYLYDNLLSKKFLEERNISNFNDYIFYAQKEVKPTFDLYKYLYGHLELIIKHKLTNRRFLVIIYELSETQLNESNYSYKNLNIQEFIPIFPLVFELIENDLIKAPENKDYDLIFPNSAESQFGYNNNLQKLLDAVPSYIESTKNADGIRVEKVVVNED